MCTRPFRAKETLAPQVPPQLTLGSRHLTCARGRPEGALSRRSALEVTGTWQRESTPYTLLDQTDLHPSISLHTHGISHPTCASHPTSVPSRLPSSFVHRIALSDTGTRKRPRQNQTEQEAEGSPSKYPRLHHPHEFQAPCYTLHAASRMPRAPS